MRNSRVLAAITLSLLVAAPVLASHVAPQFVSGATSCGPLAPGTIELVIEVPGDLGTVGDDQFSADVELAGSFEDGSISFSAATLPVSAAFVAGETGGNLYEYPEPVTSDDGLVAPEGEIIRGVSFCYVEAGAGGGEESAAPAGSEAPDGGGTDGGGEAGASDTPAASPPPTDTQPPAPVIGSVLLVGFGIALVVTGVVLAGPARPRAR